jgi:biopolymer transport protein ExbB/TolQ
MQTLPHYLDLFLLVLFGVTAALIAFKSFELFFLAPSRIEDTQDEVELDLEMEAAESLLPLLAVIASTAPFVGLAGTVMHIILALRGMGVTTLDVKVIAGPIAGALQSTLLGLASAVPASVSYSLLQRRLQRLQRGHLRLLALQARHIERGAK